MLYTDASVLGIGAVLMQQDARSKHRAIAFASPTLNRAEWNYSVTHQETLAMVWTLKHFWDINLGYPVTVFTYHAAVTELFKGRNLTVDSPVGILLFRSLILLSGIYPASLT